MTLEHREHGSWSLEENGCTVVTQDCRQGQRRLENKRGEQRFGTE